MWTSFGIPECNSTEVCVVLMTCIAFCEIWFGVSYAVWLVLVFDAHVEETDFVKF